MKEKPNLSVIDEQTGTPTWANDLAQAIWTALEKNILLAGNGYKPHTLACSTPIHVKGT